MEFLIPIIILVFSAVLHEIMHGFVADKLGDPTARLMGRLTLNPVPHLDPVMSILVPAVLVFSGSPIIFGAAKPVPVNPMHFKDPKKDMAITALAGPMTNLLLAVASAQIIKFLNPDPLISSFLFLVVLYNLMLTFVNLIPIPPLDGSKVLASFLPDNLARSYLSFQQYGLFILLGIFLLYGHLLGSLIMLAVRWLGV